MGAIVLEGVTKTFGDKRAVDRLDLSVESGRITGFIGPNGAGKTTTIRMVLSILRPDAGTIEVFGSAPERVKDRIGYLPEERGVYRRMRVAAFLAYMARLKGVRRASLGAEIRAWLDRLGLGGREGDRCEALSKGMLQKVQFVAALLHAPDLLILDEPFAGLDPVAARLLRELIVEQKAEGRTIVFSTHVMQQAEQLCDDVVMIARGKKVLGGSLASIRSSHDARAIAVEPCAGEDAGRLSALAGVRRVRADKAVHVLELTDEADPSAVVRAVAQALAVRRIEIVRPTLEDVFLSLAGPSPPEAPQGEAATP